MDFIWAAVIIIFQHELLISNYFLSNNPVVPSVVNIRRFYDTQDLEMSQQW